MERHADVTPQAPFIASLLWESLERRYDTLLFSLIRDTGAFLRM
jgi:hypothetical protein